MKHLRRRKFIEPRLQIKCAIAFACMAGLATIVQTTILNWALSDLAARLPADARTMVAGQTPALLTKTLIATFALLLPLTVMAGITFSFRFVGPLFAIKRFLRKTAAGEGPADCKIRKTDELQDLCDLANRATARQRAQDSDQAQARQAA
jgi:methyl-accepting chemotaxis protein